MIAAELESAETLAARFGGTTAARVLAHLLFEEGLRSRAEIAPLRASAAVEPDPPLSLDEAAYAALLWLEAESCSPKANVPLEIVAALRQALGEVHTERR